MKRKENSLAGFTLIEFFISAMVLSLLMIVLIGIFNIGNKVFFYDSGLVDLQQESRQAMEGMIRELRQAKIETGRPITVSADQATITFYIPNVANPVSYSLLSGQIKRTHSGMPDAYLANKINSLSFCCQGGATCVDCASSKFIQVQFQAQKTVNQRQITFPSSPGVVGGQNFIGKVRLRNAQ